DVSTDGKQFATPLKRPVGARKTADVVIWDVDTGKEVTRVPVGGNDVRLSAVAFTRDGKALVVGDAAGKVYVIDLEKKAVRHTFAGHRGPVLCLAVAADGKTVASGS